jgi:hypothetical protein
VNTVEKAGERRPILGGFAIANREVELAQIGTRAEAALEPAVDEHRTRPLPLGFAHEALERFQHVVADLVERRMRQAQLHHTRL